MEYGWNGKFWVFKNGDKVVELTPVEVAFLEHAFERNTWEYEIEMEIDNEEDNINLDVMTREEFVNACIDDLESKYELGILENKPDYQCVVFDVAQEIGIWRND